MFDWLGTGNDPNNPNESAAIAWAPNQPLDVREIDLAGVGTDHLIGSGFAVRY